MTELERLLEESGFFKGVSPESKRALAAICIRKALKKRDVLFVEADQGHAVYLLAAGGVQLYRTTAEGREVVIKTVKPGEIFAEVILFEKDRYPVSAAAVEDSLVYAIPKQRFYALLDEASFRNDFIGMLMKKQRYLVDQIVSLSAADVRERFFRFLAEQYGRKEVYQVRLSKKDVAAAIGTNPETLSRLLARLKEGGALVWEDDEIRLRKGLWQEREGERR
ncbi:MAG: Crp/Fnr family transcriptional regulator [Acidobacteriota bacterium]